MNSALAAVPSERARPSRRVIIRQRTCGALALSLAAGTLAAAPAAQAAPGPFAPSFPTVYISQSSGGDTDLKKATQSRRANAGAGGVEIATVGTAIWTGYNAVGYRVADQYLYGIVGNKLTRIANDATITDLGAVSGLPSSTYIAGSFGAGASADTLFVTGLTATTMYAINPTTKAATAITLSKTVTAADIVWAHGYLWGVSIEGGIPKVVRIATDGTVTSIDTTGALNQTETGYYGAAWAYGNGNLAFSYNSTGDITQLKVTDPGGTSPTLARVSKITGPPTSVNDGATTLAGDADLALSSTQPATGAPGDPVTWDVTVSQSSAGGSSGGTFRFDVPSGVAVSGLPTGCTTTAVTLQCVTGQLASGASDTYSFAGTLTTSLTVPQPTTPTVLGNENDPTPANNAATVTFRPAPQDRTSSGAPGGTQSTTVAKAPESSVYLLDGATRVSSITVPGQGTYTVTPSTGVITFQPSGNFAGQADTVGFVIVPATGETASGTYAASVSPPPGPVATPRTTTGVGAARQSTGALVPAGGTLTLLDASSDPTTSVPLDEIGAYQVQGDHLVFDPYDGESGTAASASYRITDSYGQSSTSTYTATVARPAVAPVSDETSTGPQGTTQQRVPAGGRGGTLVDPGGQHAAEIVVPGEGTYRAGVFEGGGLALSFEPQPCFVGVADPVGWAAMDGYGSDSNTASYTATVTGAPSAPDLTSTGIGTEVQSASTSPSAPCGETVDLLDDEGHPTATLTRPGEGTFAFDQATGSLTFTAVLGYSGTPAPATYRVTSSDAAFAEATYTPTVTAPAAPTPPAKTSTGVGTAVQSVPLQAPVGGTVSLEDGSGDPTTSVSVSGVGTWVLEPVSNVVSFVPARGFSGVAPALTYRVSDVYAQSATATYTATVTLPAPPVTSGITSTGPAGESQQRQITVPEGGSVRLLDAAGHSRTVVRVPGQGVYRLDAATGVITFAPVARFTGRATPVAYAVTDSYGQAALSSYRARVTRSPQQVGAARARAPRLVTGARVVPADCSLSTGRVRSCLVRAYARVDGRRVEVGRGSASAAREGRAGITVAVKVDRVGQSVARRPGGVRLTLSATLRQRGTAGERYASATTRLQSRRVDLRPIYFGTDLARVRPADRAYLAGVRARMRGVGKVTCVGFTDARSTTSDNLRLAKRRAHAACAVLVGKRTVGTRLVARGEARPAHTNQTKRGRALNRRAEIVLRY